VPNFYQHSSSLAKFNGDEFRQQSVGETLCKDGADPENSPSNDQGQKLTCHIYTDNDDYINFDYTTTLATACECIHTRIKKTLKM